MPIDANDPFDRVQLAELIRIRRRGRSLSEAGRTLFGPTASDEPLRSMPIASENTCSATASTGHG
jgi:sigma54-dependent transcription regulator